MRLCCSCVLWQLILKITNICLEPVRGSHLDGEEMMVVQIKLLAGGLLGEEQSSEILEAAD